jgi:hypothetical protein
VEAEVALLVEGTLDLEAGQVEVVHLVEEVLDLEAGQVEEVLDLEAGQVEVVLVEVVLTEVHRIRWRSTRS